MSKLHNLHKLIMICKSFRYKVFVTKTTLKINDTKYTTNMTTTVVLTKMSLKSKYPIDHVYSICRDKERDDESP